MGSGLGASRASASERRTREIQRYRHYNHVSFYSALGKNARKAGGRGLLSCHMAGSRTGLPTTGGVGGRGTTTTSIVQEALGQGAASEIPTSPTRISKIHTNSVRSRIETSAIGANRAPLRRQPRRISTTHHDPPTQSPTRNHNRRPAALPGRASARQKSTLSHPPPAYSLYTIRPSSPPHPSMWSWAKAVCSWKSLRCARRPGCRRNAPTKRLCNM